MGFDLESLVLGSGDSLAWVLTVALAWVGMFLSLASGTKGVKCWLGEMRDSILRISIRFLTCKGGEICYDVY